MLNLSSKSVMINQMCYITHCAILLHNVTVSKWSQSLPQMTINISVITVHDDFIRAYQLWLKSVVITRHDYNLVQAITTKAWIWFFTQQNCFCKCFLLVIIFHILRYHILSSRVKKKQKNCVIILIIISTIPHISLVDNIIVPVKIFIYPLC